MAQTPQAVEGRIATFDAGSFSVPALHELIAKVVQAIFIGRYGAGEGTHQSTYSFAADAGASGAGATGREAEGSHHLATPDVVSYGCFSFFAAR